LSKTELHIVGVNEDQLCSVCGVSKETLESLRGVLTAHGRVPHDEAVEWVRNADYTLLIRDAELRYAKAGFPTKIVESLSCGTPPVCNLSSDLAMYLKDGENAYISASHDPVHIKQALEKALETPADNRKQMRENARKTAENCFDYHQYISEMSELLQ
jgi:glycosyltransferase involved in cell wall biosynthesis